MKADNVRPFLGKLKIVLIKEGGKESFKKQLIADGKLSEDSIIEIPDAQFVQDFETGKYRSKEWNLAMIRCGTIVEMAPDAFGDLYKEKYGKDRDYYPKVNDVVFFEPGQAFQINSEAEVCLLDDTKVAGYIKSEDL